MGEYFRGTSFEAKAIYGMMIDRVSLSIKNGWLDEDGKTYIHYSVADIMADTGCGKNKILKCLKELEEDVRLIERKKQGQGRPDMIYVKNFAVETLKPKRLVAHCDKRNPASARVMERIGLSFAEEGTREYRNGETAAELAYVEWLEDKVTV